MTRQPTPPPETLDEATVALIFALRDSLDPDQVSYLDFWDGRCASAITTAAASAPDARGALTKAAEKLQIGGIHAKATEAAIGACLIIDADYEAWAEHVSRAIVYIVALAYAERDLHRRGPKPDAAPMPTAQAELGGVA